jgi:hypothetical protein
MSQSTPNVSPNKNPSTALAGVGKQPRATHEHTDTMACEVESPATNRNSLGSSRDHRGAHDNSGEHNTTKKSDPPASAVAHPSNSTEFPSHLVENRAENDARMDSFSHDGTTSLVISEDETLDFLEVSMPLKSVSDDEMRCIETLSFIEIHIVRHYPAKVLDISLVRPQMFSLFVRHYMENKNYRLFWCI